MRYLIKARAFARPNSNQRASGDRAEAILGKGCCQTGEESRETLTLYAS